MHLVAVLIQKFVLGMSLLIIIGAVVAFLGLNSVDSGDAVSITLTPNVTVFVDIPKQGKVMGNYGMSMWTYQPYLQFLGIPYAESPTNHSRFKHPSPRSPWSTTHDATKFGKRCPVITTVSELTPQELKEDLEDCLNLCVYTKDLKAKRPVMFYVYGGGFYNGSSSDHPPRHLMEKDIVVVVPQYRVGALGWAATFTPDMPGNAPLADILLALQWVQSNIRAFGGDPERVTIFGQSAGAYATSALLLSPKTPPNVFRHAIVQSGSIFSSLESDAKGQSKRICRALNCSACVRDAEVYDCLREAPVLDLLKATENESFSPVVGDFWGIMPLPPQQLVNNYNRSIPVMTGFTKHDGSFVLATYYDILKKEKGDLSNFTVRAFADGLMGIRNHQVGLTHQLFTRMLLPAELLNTTDHNRALPAYFDLSNDIFMKSPVLSLTEHLLAQKSIGVYCYSFDYAGSNTRFGYELGNEHYPFEGGIHHSNDNIYIWSTHKLNAEDTEMAKKMVDIWTSFAINGKPSAPDSPPIPPMSSPSGPYFHINTDITIDEDVLLSLTATVDDPDSQNLLRLGNVW